MPFLFCSCWCFPFFFTAIHLNVSGARQWRRRRRRQRCGCVAAPSSTSASSLQLTKLGTGSRGHKNNCNGSNSSSGGGSGRNTGYRKTCLKCTARFLVGRVGVVVRRGREGGPLRTDKWAARGRHSGVRLTVKGKGWYNQGGRLGVATENWNGVDGEGWWVCHVLWIWR